MSLKGRNCANCGRFFKDGADWSKYCKNAECSKRAVKVVDAVGGPSVVVKTHGGNTTISGSDTKVTETFQLADGTIVTKQTAVPTVIKTKTMNAHLAGDLTAAPQVAVVQNSLTTQNFTPTSTTTTVHNPVATAVVHGADGSMAVSTTSVPVQSVTTPNQQYYPPQQVYTTHTPPAYAQLPPAQQQYQPVYQGQGGQYPQGYPPGYQAPQTQAPPQQLQTPYQQQTPQQQQYHQPQYQAAPQ